MKAGPRDREESAGSDVVIAMETTHYNSIKRERKKKVKFIVLPVTVFMFHTYISMKSHHTKGSGRFSRDWEREGNLLCKRALFCKRQNKKTEQKYLGFLYKPAAHT